MNNEEKVAVAYTSLTALKSNLPDISIVGENYVREFHSILDLLAESTGYELARFGVPSSEVQPTIVSGNYRTGETTYSEAKYCERSFLMMKIDAVLGFFKIVSAHPKPGIGFKPT